jgi:hypothetical protein
MKIMITPIPVTYSGIRFRSTLEADWAATLDSLGIEWQYEPEGVQLPSGSMYRPDFYLPRIATWLEVKGPAGDRLGKTRELAEAVAHYPECTGRCENAWDLSQLPPECEYWWDPYQLVVVGLAPVRGVVTSWLIDLSAHDDDQENRTALVKCHDCGAWWWCGSGAFGCRAHRRGGGGDDDLHGGHAVPAFVQLKQLGYTTGGGVA